MQRRKYSLQSRVKMFPCLGVHTAQLAIAPATIGVAQPALDRAPIARLKQQCRRLLRRGGDEFLALFADLLLQCRLLRKIPSGGCIGFLAGAVEAFPKRLGYATPLLVECTPFVAKFLHFGRKVRSIQPERSRRLGALAKLNAGLVLPERFPTFELF